MTAATADIAPLEALARIEELIDLSDILRKLADPKRARDSRPRIWTSSRPSTAGSWLCIWPPGADIVRCKVIDDIWHQHPRHARLRT